MVINCETIDATSIEDVEVAEPETEVVDIIDPI